MNIEIKSSSVQFKNPQVGQPTRAVEEHYYGRRIIVDVDGEEQVFRFLPTELPFEATEADFILAIQTKLTDETATE